jgi:hypothetical protein
LEKDKGWNKGQGKVQAEAWDEAVAEAEWEALVREPVPVDIASARVVRKELFIRQECLAILWIVQNVGQRW